MRNVEDIYPLSPMQRLMLLHGLATEDTVLGNQVVYEIRGALDESRWERAWERLTEWTPVLRTAFVWEGLKRPMQVVRERVSPDLRTIDLRGLSDAERASRVDELLQEDRSRAYRVEKAPLMRVTLLRLGDEEWMLVWNLHHLIVDRWSHELLVADLRHAYRDPDAAPPERRPFRDYVRWLRARSPVDAEGFWRRYLKGLRRPATLVSGGANKDGPPESSGTRQTRSRRIRPDAWTLLEERAAGTGTTVGSWVQAAIALTLARRTGLSDVAYGLTVSGRPADLPGSDTMIGSFVTNVPARFRLAEGTPVLEWIREIQSQQAVRQPFEYLSLSEIRAQAPLPPGRPLFDLLVLLNLTFREDPPERNPELPLRAISATLDAGTPLLLAFTRDDVTATVRLVHDDRLGPSGAEQLLDTLEEALDGLIRAEGGSPLGDLAPDLADAPADPDPPPALEDSPSPVGGSTPDPSDRAQLLLGIWRDILGREELGMDDDFLQAGGTSLQAAQLFDRIERSLGVQLPLSVLFQAGTVRKLLEELAEPGTATAAPTLIAVQPSGTAPPLYVAPGIGGDVVGLHALAKALGSGQPVYALRSRGLQGECDPLTTVESIADDHAATVAAAGDGPIDLLGVCSGAAIVFEMVPRIERRGRRVRSVALMDPAVLLSTLPERPDDVGTRSFLRGRIELYWDEFKEADWEDRGRLVLSKATRAVRAFRRGLDEETRAQRNRHRVREANREAVLAYEPLPREMTACLFITPAREHDFEHDPRLAWVSLIRPEPGVRHVDGENSGDAIAPENVDSLARELTQWLSEVRGTVP